MSKAQQVFEAMMVAKGYTDLTQVKGRYTSPAIQICRQGHKLR